MTVSQHMLGSACTGAADCDVTNSVCSNNVCACANGYRDTSTNCWLVLGESCKAESACTTYVNNSECTSFTCSCITGYQPDNDLCTAVLDGSCTEDSNCTTYLSNSECTSNTCSCITGYKPDNNVCTTVYHGGCGNISDCNTHMPNTNCDSNSLLCVCDTDYTYDSESVTCQAVATTAPAPDNTTATPIGYGEQCSATSECVAHSSCTRGTCSCNAGYKTNGTMCQKIIGGPCVYTSQCTYYEPNSNCIIGSCKCLDGYYETEVLCSKGGQAQTFSFLVVIAHVIFVAMVTKRLPSSF
ncbi:prion-like-(Q/N-rich) domain-bearing protein 25 [Ruditapes philippinarum]|uniref:prion-like-(Q/N-rich) domain-bearing protein 25 n=1 Tax=Ruditapes philippinarum TaxID=129788 RepID=UPI00295B540C|nr:prion-like-(Q/N-rich) domain-bearing protein 25 [Ruditapes philippinarum]